MEETIRPTQDSNPQSSGTARRDPRRRRTSVRPRTSGTRTRTSHTCESHKRTGAPVVAVVVVVDVINVSLADDAGPSPWTTVSGPMDRVRAGQGRAATGRTNDVSVLQKKKKKTDEKSQ